MIMGGIEGKYSKNEMPRKSGQISDTVSRISMLIDGLEKQLNLTQENLSCVLSAQIPEPKADAVEIRPIPQSELDDRLHTIEIRIQYAIGLIEDIRNRLTI